MLHSALGSKNNAVTANNRNTTPPIKVTEKRKDCRYLMFYIDVQYTIGYLRKGWSRKYLKTSALLRCYMVSVGSRSETFWDNLSMPTSRVKHPPGPALLSIPR
jgi:hypothetical protein